jgi:Cysteine dioxygenase type I
MNAPPFDRAFARDLDRPALLELVTAIAFRPTTWRGLAAPDPLRRHFAQLWRDDHIDVWVISWMRGHDTGFHDHDLSSGAVAVVQGELVEERLALGGPPVRRVYRAGEAFDFAASHVHRMFQEATSPAVSVHAYSPPLWRMGAYVIAPDGTIRRDSISYAEELRPVDSAA